MGILSISFENTQTIYPVKQELIELIIKSAELCIRNEELQDEYEVFILITDNNEIKEINKAHREIDKETDVLSFPMLDFIEGNIEEINDSDINPETGNIMLGDIIISIEKVLSQAKEYNHSFERELIFLITHGMYHLLGYDHQDEEQEKEMIAKQELVLQEMGLNRA